jgi:hypothetical protein
MEIEVKTQFSKYLETDVEKALFGEVGGLSDIGLALGKITDEGISLKPNRGSYKSILLPARKCERNGKARRFVFDTEDIEEFMESLPFEKAQAVADKSMVDEIKHTLELTMDLKIYINDDGEVILFRGKKGQRGLSQMLCGYKLMDLADNADISVKAVLEAKKRIGKKNAEIRNKFHEDMKAAGAERNWYF